MSKYIYALKFFKSARSTIPHTICYHTTPEETYAFLEVKPADGNPDWQHSRVELIRVSEDSKEYKMAVYNLAYRENNINIV